MNRLSSQQPKAALKLGSAATIETGSPKGFPETRKPQASAESRERSDHCRAATRRAAPALTQPSNGFLEIVLLNVLEVLVRAHLDFSASSLIANDDSAVVLLEGRNGPNLSDGTFDGSL